MPHDPLLTLVTLPMILGLVCLVLPEKARSLIKIAALLVTGSSFALSLSVFLSKKPVVYTLGSGTLLIADNLSAFIALGISFFALVVTIYSCGFIQKSFGRYFGYTLMTLGAALGVALSNNIIAVLVFWGFMAALLYLLVSMRSTDRASAAAKKALIIIGGTDTLMIFGIGILWTMTGSFSIDRIHLPLNSLMSYLAFLSIAIACFAKAGAVPFHSWLPDVAEDALTPVSAYLPASLDKFLGIYLLARTSLNLFEMSRISNFILLAVGSVTIIMAVMMALVQHDLKRLLGYHAVSQVGYMVLGIGTGSAIGIAGALFHMLNNTIYKTCLFMGGGAVEMRTQTTDLSKLGGLSKFMPVTFACFLVASLSISGIPPFNGFVSKWMIYQGIVGLASAKNPMWIIWLLCAMFGSALTIASFMKLLHAVFLGRSDKKFHNVVEAGFPMLLPMVILAALCLIFGVFSFVLPLPLLIIPAVPGALVFIGLWTPIIATILIIIGISVGIFSYGLFKTAKFRTVKAFIGGEDPDTLMRISGTEFYDTIKDAKGLNQIYRKEADGSLDIYNIFKRIIFFLMDKFQRLHNGILPTYMVWCLLGMVAMFLILFFR
ncbi:MAG: proton-conducting transporter membrane subunit [Candidatus Omnitrophota bacterium]|jgi:formate hydrogenlyase subunit 3/multisubunit Na+/H+ antiporter MnhD subunit